MRLTCPRCGGQEFLNDLGLIQTDLYYSRGILRSPRQADSPNAGPPPLACDVCKGQGWVDSANLLFLFDDGSDIAITNQPMISPLLWMSYDSDGDLSVYTSFHAPYGLSLLVDSSGDITGT